MSSPLNARNIHGVGFNTTDATQSVAATIPTYTDSVFQVVASIVAAATADRSKAASYVLVGAFKNNGGTLTQIGSTTVLSFLETDAGWDVAFAVSGTDIQLKVTGVAATAISWLLDAQIKNLSAYYANGGIIGQEA